MRIAALSLALLTVAGCSTFSESGRSCETGALRVSADFEGARASACRKTPDRSFEIVIAPETTPINPSPWYAFDIHATVPETVQIELAYAYAKHRYRPKVKFEQQDWSVIDDVDLLDEGRRARFSLPLGAGVTRISAQESSGLDAARDFANRIGAATDARVSVAGVSVENRDLLMISNHPAANSLPLIVITGRQHPPEMAGSVGLYAFVDRLFGSDDLARMFRSKHKLLIFPLMNPDGVVAGNWRANANKVDINRDWGPFTQPETMAVRDAIASSRDQGASPVLLLDFHATKSDLFYTPEHEDRLVPENFSSRWLARLEAMTCDRVPEPRPGWNPDLPTAKSWFAQEYGAPAITVEFGDESDRDYIRRISVAAAEALMQEFLLAEPVTSQESAECWN